MAIPRLYQLASTNLLMSTCSCHQHASHQLVHQLVYMIWLSQLGCHQIAYHQLAHHQLILYGYAMVIPVWFPLATTDLPWLYKLPA